MPILGEKRKYEIERASKERPARSKPLEHSPRKWPDRIMNVCGVVFFVLLLAFIALFCAFPGFFQW